MTIIKSAREMILFRQCGFVPTMGALHEGHLSLVARARDENAKVVVSIFVNPTQFNSSSDFANYPQTLDTDLALLEKAGVDVVFLPHYNELYADDYAFKVTENRLTNILCGPTRPGHFDGMLTVVLKLLQIVSPARAYFGEKDYQQYLLIRDMAKAFFLKSEIIPCPTLREADGLAMSSRNVRLTPGQREKAPLIFKAITGARTADEAKKILSQEGFAVDYVEEHFGRRFVAAHLGDVRLIDNVAI